MFDYLKKSFTKGSTEDEILSSIERISTRNVSDGAKLADDCLVNGLRKGEIVKLCEMDVFIESQGFFSVEAAKYGFHQRMCELVDSGEIVTLSVEGGDAVFVHRDYVHTFMEALNNAERLPRNSSLDDVNVFESWVIHGAIHDGIPVIGNGSIKQGAISYFAEYGEAKSDNGYCDFPMSLFGNDGTFNLQCNLHFYPQFCVLEMFPDSDRTTFIAFRPDTPTPEEARKKLYSVMVLYQGKRLLRDAVGFIKRHTGERSP